MQTNSNQEPASIVIHNRYGISKKTLHTLILETFELLEQYKDSLSVYLLRHWETRYFILKNEDGIITYEGNKYIVNYINCTPYQIHSLTYQQLKLSFRLPKKELGIPGYVLVKPIVDSNYNWTLD